MAQKRPFLEDGSQYGVSRSQFRRMRKAEKREAMLQWFSENYEDPAENTPYESAEGGYQYIWGGPYEARDELYAQFGDIVPEQLIEEVAQEIERHGTFDWAPVQKGEDPDDRGFSDEDDEPAPLDIYLDEPSPQYGTPAEQDARKKALIALERLEKIITKRQAIGIGHNQPPETVDGPDLPEVQKAVAELKLEFHQLDRAAGRHRIPDHGADQAVRIDDEGRPHGGAVGRVQTSDREAVSTPEGWRHGDAVIEPAPITVDALRDSDPSGDTLDWYYRLRRL